MVFATELKIYLSRKRPGTLLLSCGLQIKIFTCTKVALQIKYFLEMVCLGMAYCAYLFIHSPGNITGVIVTEFSSNTFTVISQLGVDRFIHVSGPIFVFKIH